MNNNQTKTIILLTNSLSTTAGGRTASIFRRAKLLTETGYPVFIGTKNYKTNYGDIFDYLCKKYNVQNVGLLNCFEYLAEESIYKIHPSITEEEINVGVIETKDCERLVYNADGNLFHKKVFRSPIEEDKDNLAKAVWYVPDSQRVYLYCSAAPTSGISGYYWNRKDGTVQRFIDRHDMAEYWISVLNDKFNHPIFISEEHFAINQVINNRYCKEPMTVIGMVHGNIFDEPFTTQAPLREYYKNLLDNAYGYSAIVVLSDMEATHIRNCYGIYDRLFTIPHPLDAKTVVDSNVEKDEHLITICSRLDPLKRINHAIKAVQKVIEKYPMVKLHIYGRGDEYENLQKLINDLGVENNVKLMGYTSKPLEMMKKSAFTLLTSLHEGLGLTFYESLSVGTPVVTYDFLYGPRVFIRQNENGCIVENGNIDALAECIIGLFDEPERIKAMSKAATTIDYGLSDEDIAERWSNLFDTITPQPDVRSLKEVLEISLNNVKKLETDGEVVLQIEVSVRYDGKIDNSRKTDYYLNWSDSRAFDLFESLYTEGTIVNTNGKTQSIQFEIRCDSAAFSDVIAKMQQYYLDIIDNGYKRRFTLDIIEFSEEVLV